MPPVGAEEEKVELAVLPRAPSRQTDAAPAPTRRRWRPSSFALNAVGLLFALSLLVALGGPRTSISADEGAAIHQAILLQRGGWVLTPTLPELDPELVQQPFNHAASGPKGGAPYVRHPLYPLLLQQMMRLWWPSGLVVPNVVGVWVAAVAAALLARALRAGAALPTLWLVGLGGPLAVDAQMVLAHAPAAGTAGLAALAAGVVLAPDAFGPRAHGRHVSAAAIVLATLGAAVTVALRSEGVLLVAGLVVGTLVAGAPWRRFAPLAAGLTAGAVAAQLFEAAVVRSAIGIAAGAASPPSTRSGFVHARVQAFQASWLDTGISERPGELFVGVGAVALALAVAGARWRARTAVVAGLVVVAVGGTVAWLVDPEVDLIPGLLPATPWLVAGILSVRPRTLQARLPRFLAGASLAAGGAILATQYSIGGGVEWGGRYYAIVLPVVAPLAITGVWPPGPGWWSARRSPAVLGIVAVSALLSLGGLLAVRTGHEQVADLSAELAAAGRSAPPERPQDPDPRPVVVGPQELWPRLLWPLLDDYRWVAAKSVQLPCSLYGLRAAGFQRVVLLGPFIDHLSRVAGEQGWRPVGSGDSLYIRVLEADPAGPAAPPTCPPSPPATTPVR